jgi:DNA-binding MarR family transcriptional regulator
MTNRLENLVGALGLALSDTIADSFEPACELSDSAPAALFLIRFNPETRIEALARYLELSHSGTVRLVDRLVREGWVAREACDDLRAVVLVLTPAGEKMLDKLVENRSKSIAQAMQGFSAAERAVLEKLVSRMLVNLVPDRAAADHTCRLCDSEVCDKDGCPLECRNN